MQRRELTIEEMNYDKIHFFTLNTSELWKKGECNKVSVKTDGIQIESYEKYEVASDIKYDHHDDFHIALDMCDRFYYLDLREKKLNLMEPRIGYRDTIGVIRLENPKKIAVGESDIFILDDQCVKVYAKVNYQLRRKYDHFLNPAQIAVDKKDNLYVLDLLSDSKFAIHRISYSGAATKLKEEADYTGPIYFAVDDRIACTIFVLDAGKKKIMRYTQGEVGTVASEEISVSWDDQFEPSDLAIDDRGNMYIGNKHRSGLQPRRYDKDGEVQPLDYEGQSHQLLFAPNRDLFILDKMRKTIYRLRPVTRYLESGTYLSDIFDSKKPDLQWHRLTLMSLLPDNTSISVRCRAWNDKEPDASIWNDELLNPKDAFLNSKGRYARLEITLKSLDNVSTPTIRELRLHFPRITSLRFLPAIYREEPSSRGFLERFLSIFDTMISDIDANIKNLTKLIDPEATPDDFLPWLSSWLALGYNEGWSADQLRRLIRKAPMIYKMRGTKEGLLEFILTYLYTRDEINRNRIMFIENFQLECADNAEDFEKLFCLDPYSFCVLVDSQDMSTEKLNMIKRIIDNEKPAHTVGHVQLLQPWFFYGMHTYLGMNTCYSEQTFILEQSALGRDSALSSQEESGQISIRSKIGVDNKIT